MNKFSSFHRVLTVVALLVAAPLGAQQLVGLRPGTRVRVTIRASEARDVRQSGTTDSLRRDTLFFRRDGTWRTRPATVALDSVLALEVGRKDRVIGFVFGALSSAAIGVLFNAATGQTGEDATRSLMIGTTGGALMGAAFPTFTQWTTVPFTRPAPRDTTRR